MGEPPVEDKVKSKKDAFNSAKTPFERMQTFAQIHCINVPEGCTESMLSEELKKSGIDKTKLEEIKQGTFRGRDRKQQRDAGRQQTAALSSDKRDEKGVDSKTKAKNALFSDKDKRDRDRDRDKAKGSGKGEKKDEKTLAAEKKTERKRKWKPAFQATAYDWKRFHPVFSKAGPGGAPQLALANSAANKSAQKPAAKAKALALCWTDRDAGKTVKSAAVERKALPPAMANMASAKPAAPKIAAPPKPGAPTPKGGLPVGKASGKELAIPQALLPPGKAGSKAASPIGLQNPKGAPSTKVSAPPPITPKVQGVTSIGALGTTAAMASQSAAPFAKGPTGNLGARAKASSKASAKVGAWSKPSEASGFDMPGAGILPGGK